jgi:hypothetical protein
LLRAPDASRHLGRAPPLAYALMLSRVRRHSIAALLFSGVEREIRRVEHFFFAREGVM